MKSFSGMKYSNNRFIWRFCLDGSLSICDAALGHAPNDYSEFAALLVLKLACTPAVRI